MRARKAPLWRGPIRRRYLVGYYRTILRAKRPPATSKMPAPNAARDAPPVSGTTSAGEAGALYAASVGVVALAEADALAEALASCATAGEAKTSARSVAAIRVLIVTRFAFLWVFATRLAELPRERPIAHDIIRVFYIVPRRLPKSSLSV